MPTPKAEPSTDLVRIDAATEALLDQAIEHLRSLAHTALVDYAVATGRYLIETFYDGNLGAYYDHRRDKASSFNALCEHRADELAAIGLSRSTLQRYIHAYDTFRVLPPEAREAMSLRSVELLRRVPDQVTRTEIALAAVRQGWSPAELRAEVEAKAAELRPSKSKRGRPPLAPGEKALRGLVRQAKVVAEAKGEIAALPVERVEALRAELLEALAVLEGVWG
ncbi:MAG: hypothetical protein H6747_13900 [Deltaproteobacteria bacterium]|nr:hypothetical protein [Myxococcales bacterium]MCB9740350.1 hypothetical protein [Deltaproteobacteria bacterium]